MVETHRRRGGHSGSIGQSLPGVGRLWQAGSIPSGSGSVGGSAVRRWCHVPLDRLPPWTDRRAPDWEDRGEHNGHDRRERSDKRDSRRRETRQATHRPGCHLPRTAAIAPYSAAASAETFLKMTSSISRSIAPHTPPDAHAPRNLAMPWRSGVRQAGGLTDMATLGRS